MPAMYKTLFALSIISLLAIMVYGDAGPTQPFDVTVPTFSDPFAARSFTFTISADGFFAPLNVRGDSAVDAGYCDADEYPVDNDWYGCLNTPDRNGTYLTTGFGGSSEKVSVNLSGFPDSTVSSWRAVSVSVKFQCKGDGSGIGFDFSNGTNPVFLRVSDAAGKSSCHKIGTAANDDSNEAAGYVNVTLTEDVTLADIRPAESARGIGGANLTINNGGAIGDDDLLFVSYVAVTVRYQRSVDCSFQDAGNPWDNIVRATYFIGCVGAAFATFFFDLIAFGLNLVFYLGAWVVFIGAIVGNALAVVAWLYAIPGMPLPFQVILDAILTVMLAIIGMEFFALIRGGGGFE